MSGAASRALQAVACVGRGLSARDLSAHSSEPQLGTTMRAENRQLAPHSVSSARSSGRAPNWLRCYRNQETTGSMLLQMARSAPRSELNLRAVHRRIGWLAFLGAILPSPARVDSLWL